MSNQTSNSVYMCTNCNWSGTTEDMDIDMGVLSCPECCATFHTEEPTRGPWQCVWDEDDEENFDADTD